MYRTIVALPVAAVLRCFVFTVFALLIWLPLSAQLPEGFARVRLAEGLDPTAMALAPDGRIFIAEKHGTIRIVRDEALLSDPFLRLEVDNFNERGLSGIAFDPAFEQNNYIYLYYTVAGEGYNRISRVTANGDYAIPGSEEVLLELDPLSGTIHNGGAMAFGADGKLYIATGDGTLPENAQSMNSLLGKVLRLNSDGSIPADNPFYDQAQGKYRAIWARGLRNPYTFAIQPGTGRIFANDVGSQYWEEVNEIVRGGNYGWAGLEGERSGEQVPDNYRDPVYAYDHLTGCAVIGAAFYNPARPVFPEPYYDKYFFADYCEGYIKVLDPDDGTVAEVFATGIDRPIGMLVDEQGALYYLARAGMGGGSPQDNTSSSNGSLWRVTYTGSGAAVVSTQPSDITVPVGEEARFEVTATGAQPLAYQWLRDGIPIEGGAQPTLLLPEVTLADSGSLFRCRVSNGQSEIFSREATLHVTTNKRPVPEILEPETGATYRAGDTLFFRGRASDAENGNLNAGQLQWRIDFHHNEHTHPGLQPSSGISQGQFIIPQIGEIDDNVWYRIHLKASDAEGLSRTVYRDVLPEKTRFTVVSEPPGLEVNIDGRLLTTPQTLTSVRGIRRTLSAAPVQSQGNTIYRFTGWSGGWQQGFYPFIAGEQDTIRLFYETLPLSIGDGRGLLGEYFHGEGTGAFETEPVLSRIDSVVNFDWVFGSPAPAVNDDFFLARWRGEVMPPLDGSFTFHVISDDGIRLWVDDQLLIDQWTPQAATESRGTITLEGGRRYPIRLEYFEAAGHAVARLLWSSEGMAPAPIPASQLFPAARLDFEGLYTFRRFPSPAREWLRVEVASKVDDEVDLHIFDMNGRAVLQRQGLIVTRGLNSWELPLGNLSAGIYLLELKGLTYISEVEKIAVH